MVFKRPQFWVFKYFIFEQALFYFKIWWYSFFSYLF